MYFTCIHSNIVSGYVGKMSIGEIGSVIFDRFYCRTNEICWLFIFSLLSLLAKKKIDLWDIKFVNILLKCDTLICPNYLSPVLQLTLRTTYRLSAADVSKSNLE
uniref:Uncharacterized protein n=1 Tax=Rhizophagus irregularis (strain DAOM 181602 / DAOM 197198 / MUCL 43194) TaxID=747089 RepID=U9UBV1_RHIID